MRVPFLIAVLFIAGCAVAPSPAVFAGARFDPGCTTIASGQRQNIAFADSVHALVVFVAFPDDQADIPEWPLTDNRGRTVPRWTLPPLATNIIEPLPERVRASLLTPGDSSLSAYFYYQSQNAAGGPHILSGEVWPQQRDGTPYVYVPEKPTQAYHNVGADGERQRSGYGYLTEEIVRALEKMPGFDIGRFDATCDGVLDHMMVVIRRDHVLPKMQGWAILSGYYQAGGSPRRPLRIWSPLRQDSVLVDWTLSGSQNMSPGFDGRRLLTHEYGHSLWRMGHTAMITQNDVPLERKTLVAERRTNLGCIYNRMCGSAPSGGYDEASSTLSGSELRRAGWAVRTVLDPADGDRPGVQLRDLYRSGEVALVPLSGVSFADTLSLENRQRTNFFDEVHRTDWKDPFYGIVFSGLGTTGLLATLSKGDPGGRGGPLLYDVLFADNSFGMETWCDGTAGGCGGFDFYKGDMYGPDTKRQITPWTRPNTSGLTIHRSDVAVNWFAIDAIRYTGDSESTMVFDFVADVRRGAILTADSWMGDETGGEVLGPIRVERGATLTIAAGAIIDFSSGLVIDAGATVAVGSGATLRFGRDQALVVSGVLAAESARFAPISARSAWAGIDRRGQGVVRIGDSRVSGAGR